MPAAGLIPCGHCSKGRMAVGGGELDAEGAVAKCGVCGISEFYRQKDFNTKLGLWMVGLIVVTALIFNRWLIPILVGGAVLDTALYFLLPEVVVCYACRAIYRGLPVNPKVEGFDLKIHDKYAFKKKQ